ncbi:MAG: hypothetical protein ABJB73_08720 [Candidatus Nitrosocosmicus sp.]
MSNVVEEHGQHPGLTSNDGSNWYLQACKFLKIDHHIHFFVYKNEKSPIKKTIQCIKDRKAQCFDNFFSCKKKKCRLPLLRIRMGSNYCNIHNKEVVKALR